MRIAFKLSALVFIFAFSFGGSLLPRRPSVGGGSTLTSFTDFPIDFELTGCVTEPAISAATDAASCDVTTDAIGGSGQSAQILEGTYVGVTTAGSAWVHPGTGVDIQCRMDFNMVTADAWTFGNVLVRALWFGGHNGFDIMVDSSPTTLQARTHDNLGGTAIAISTGTEYKLCITYNDNPGGGGADSLEFWVDPIAGDYCAGVTGTYSHAGTTVPSGPPNGVQLNGGGLTGGGNFIFDNWDCGTL